MTQQEILFLFKSVQIQLDRLEVTSASLSTEAKPCSGSTSFSTEMTTPSSAMSKKDMSSGKEVHDANDAAFISYLALQPGTDISTFYFTLFSQGALAGVSSDQIVIRFISFYNIFDSFYEDNTNLIKPHMTQMEIASLFKILQTQFEGAGGSCSFTEMVTQETSAIGKEKASDKESYAAKDDALGSYLALLPGRNISTFYLKLFSQGFLAGVSTDQIVIRFLYFFSQKDTLYEKNKELIKPYMTQQEIIFLLKRLQIQFNQLKVTALLEPAETKLANTTAVPVTETVSVSSGGFGATFVLSPSAGKSKDTITSTKTHPSLKRQRSNREECAKQTIELFRKSLSQHRPINTTYSNYFKLFKEGSPVSPVVNCPQAGDNDMASSMYFDVLIENILGPVERSVRYSSNESSETKDQGLFNLDDLPKDLSHPFEEKITVSSTMPGISFKPGRELVGLEAALSDSMGHSSIVGGAIPSVQKFSQHTINPGQTETADICGELKIETGTTAEVNCLYQGGTLGNKATAELLASTNIPITSSNVTQSDFSVEKAGPATGVTITSKDETGPLEAITVEQAGCQMRKPVLAEVIAAIIKEVVLDEDNDVAEKSSDAVDESSKEDGSSLRQSDSRAEEIDIAVDVEAVPILNKEKATQILLEKAAACYLESHKVITDAELDVRKGGLTGRVESQVVTAAIEEAVAGIISSSTALLSPTASSVLVESYTNLALLKLLCFLTVLPPLPSDSFTSQPAEPSSSTKTPEGLELPVLTTTPGYQIFSSVEQQTSTPKESAQKKRRASCSAIPSVMPSDHQQPTSGTLGQPIPEEENPPFHRLRRFSKEESSKRYRRFSSEDGTSSSK